jgi:hypothetical protein
MLRWGVLVAVVAAAGCSGDSDGRGPSCALATVEGELIFCVDYGSGIVSPEARESCDQNQGIWDDEPCDDTGAVARCTYLGTSIWYYRPYLDAGVTIDQLRGTCEMQGGTFTEL